MVDEQIGGRSKILIVDDSEMNRSILADMLGDEFSMFLSIFYLFSKKWFHLTNKSRFFVEIITYKLYHCQPTNVYHFLYGTAIFRIHFLFVSIKQKQGHYTKFM